MFQPGSLPRSCTACAVCHSQGVCPLWEIQECGIALSHLLGEEPLQEL